jgi:OmcA/MtrC family decaheme c-type cytochrome
MYSSIRQTLKLALLILATAFLFACDDGNDGTAGTAGAQGPEGPAGPAGTDGADGSSPLENIMVGDGSELTPAEIATLGQLVVEITGVTVSSPPVVDFRVTDSQGDPALGIAEGVVWFTFAKLMPADPDANGGLPYWQSYVNVARTSTNPTGLTDAIQATTDNAGTLLEMADGNYSYTFATDVTAVTAPIPVVWQPNLTHRVGLEIRLGGEGEGPLAPDNPVYDFVPDGGVGSGVGKNIADTDNCKGCHFDFDLHGGPRKTVEYCVTCHNPGTVDPDTGNSVDMAFLAHSIHMGDDRTNPYVVIGYGGSVHGYGEVTYPQSKTYCETCHTTSAKTPDGDDWNEGATAKSCGGCHDNGLLAENFDAVTGQAEYSFDHVAAGADVPVGTAQDGLCAGCHLGGIEYAGPALAVHSKISGDDRFRDELGDDFVFEILDAINTGPLETPVITFKVSHADGTPYNVLTDPEFLSSSSALNLYVAWSTDDIYNGDELGLTGGFRDRGLGAGAEPYGPGHPNRMYLAALQRDIPAQNADGSFTVTYFTPMPEFFSGDAMISLGGHPAAVGVADADGVVGDQRAAPVSAVYYAGVPREVGFDNAKCGACHELLQFHGSNRNGEVAICLNCHNADLAEGGEGFALGRMVHSIHSASTTFAGGEFEGVTYPQSVANCDTCHVPGSYDVPRMEARSVSIDGGLDEGIWTDDAATTPAAANCGACHNDIASMGHFSSQGGQVGVMKSDILTVGGLPNGQEACAVCHAAGSEFETDRYHNPGLEH